MTQQAIPVAHLVPRSTLRTLIAKVAEPIATIIARRQEERTQRAVVAELHRFPDYLLSDMGVVRGELPVRAPRLLDFHPHLIASRVVRGSSILPPDMSSR